MWFSLSTFLSLYSPLPPLPLSLTLPPPPPTRLAAEPSRLALPPTWEPRVPHLHPSYTCPVMLCRVYQLVTTTTTAPYSSLLLRSDRGSL